MKNVIFPLSNAIVTSSFNQSIVDISQINMEELIRNIGEKEVTRLLKKVIENNIKILELQKMLVIIMRKNKEERRRKQKRENRRREYEER